MTRVATLYVRNVPDELYEQLRARAAREGRSIGAEALAILRDAFESERRGEELVARLRALNAEVRLSPDAPRPEDIIREARDERARRL
jgi:plasmid stability protein